MSTTFTDQHREALVRQRDALQNRLARLRRDILRVETNTNTDPITAREVDDKIRRLNRLAAKWVNDIERLNMKIAEL